MLFEKEKGLTEKYVYSNPDFLEVVGQLENENELLKQKIDELMVAEQQLLVRIDNALYLKRQRNAELKEKVKLLEHKCEELEEFLQSITTSTD